MKLINNRVLEPQLVAFELRLRIDVSHDVHGKAFTRSSGITAQDPVADRCANGPRLNSDKER
jgi:hypothetical protein